MQSYYYGKIVGGPIPHPHTSLGGLGKTTLTTKLCWDEHAKSKPIMRPHASL